MRIIPHATSVRSWSRRGLSAVAALVLSTGLVALATPTAHAQTACSVDYSIANDWSTGATVNVTIQNQGSSTVNGWTLAWTFPGNQQITNLWNGGWNQSGSNVTVNDVGWNGTIPAGGTASFGFNLNYSGSNAVPSGFTLNGAACTGGGPGNGNGGQQPPPGRVANPYEGAQLYVNPEWSAQAASSGGSAIANQPTAIWLDRRVAIYEGSAGENTMGLEDHMDEAVAQGADAIQVVIYNLPGRDCAALASSGELGPDEIDVYESEYIDPIAEIMGQDKYSDLRIITVIEIDSLPNLITNVGSRETATPQCDEMLANGNYVNGVGYALEQLGSLGNVYNYVDIGHHGWLGWDDNFEPFADLVVQMINTTGASATDIHGFAANVANYGALEEPYFSITDTASDGPVRSESSWIDWNNYIDEVSYAQAYQQLFSSRLGHQVGMIIDTSRNGWGGPDRPSGPGDLNATADEYVDASRVDRRIHLGNWCNQAGAGIGERTQVSPESGIHAYTWIKPPGESDGSSQEIPNDEGKGFDEMCDPAYQGNPRNLNNPSGALPDAPISGHWFQAQFDELIANAYPPL